MTARKTDFFGTFLDSYKANTASTTSLGSASPRSSSSSAAEPNAEREPSIDAMLKVWPTKADATMSVVAIARTFGVSLNSAASALKSMADVGLVENRGGSFALTPLGRDAIDLKK